MPMGSPKATAAARQAERQQVAGAAGAGEVLRVGAPRGGRGGEGGGRPCSEASINTFKSGAVKSECVTHKNAVKAHKM